MFDAIEKAEATDDARFEEATAAATAPHVPPAAALPERQRSADATEADGAGKGLHWTYGLVNRLVKVADGTLLGLAGLGAWLGVHGTAGTVVTPMQAAILTLIGTGVALHGMAAIGAYRVERCVRRSKALLDLAAALIPAGLAVLLLVWAFLPLALDTPLWLEAWAVAAVALPASGRLAAGWIVGRMLDRGTLRRKVVVFGATECAERVILHLSQHAQRQEYEIVALFDDRGADRRPERLAGLPVAGDLATFKAYMQDHRVDMVVIALPWSAALRIHGLLTRLQMISLDVLVPLDEDDFMLRFAQVRHVGGLPALLVMRQPLKGTQIVLKRIEDLVVATVGLLVASPVMLAALIAVKLDSPGPAIFRQTRVGFNDRPFTMLKFRTMLIDESDDGALGTHRDNPRITRIGGLLRRTSLDELPQLFNVLMGDMSIVGPRAHVPNMLVSDRRYADAVREYAGRCRVKPGITGWAQINGMRGGIHSLGKARTGVELDIHYIENWSLWLDLKIIVRTVATGMFGRDIF